MRFHMLGPLEVVSDEGRVVLGGTKQRATLGFLLLHPNQVVPTSRLLKALWTVDEAPASARKILHNAVWSLRTALSSGERDPESPVLLTRNPGYVLRVDPDRVDLHRFTQLARQGRELLAEGDAENAATLLRDSLRLWRGHALSDIVETGTSWPELTALQNARLDATEDYFDAELACGRHHAVLSDLETMLDSGTLRERSCGQLMLALYRSGRQSDALSAFARFRADLVEDMGLEPGRALQALQQSILAQDPDLMPLPVTAPALASPVLTATRRDADVAVRAPLRESPLRESEVARSAVSVLSGREPRPRPPRQREPGTERRLVTAVVLRVGMEQGDSPPRPEDIDDTLEGVTAMIREEVEACGGHVSALIGSVSLALFGAAHPGEDDAVRAVLAALTIRDRLEIRREMSADDQCPVRGLDVRIAIATGVVPVRPSSLAGASTVGGSLVDECYTLLEHTEPGEIMVTDGTRGVTEGDIIYESRGTWALGRPVRSVHYGLLSDHVLPIVDRESELNVLHELVDRTRHRGTPYLVTALGEQGMGKTRLVTEFVRRIGALRPGTRVVIGSVPAGTRAGSIAVHAGILDAYCGVLPGDGAVVAGAKLAAVVRGLVPSEEEREWLVRILKPLVGRDDERRSSDGEDEAAIAWRHLLADQEDGVRSPADVTAIFDAWWYFVQRAALDAPLVLVVDDLHNADDSTLDFMENLAESSTRVPLLVVATARPDLLARRPGWGGGKRHAATIMLDPLSDEAVDRLLHLVLSSEDGGMKGSMEDRALRSVLADLEHEPALRRRYLRKLLAYQRI